MRPRDTTPESHDVQMTIYARLGPAGRARLAGQLSEDARELARCGIRARHPEYAEVEVEFAFRRILYGDELFRRAWPKQPLLEP